VGIAANLLDNIISSTAVVDTVVIVVAAVTTAVAAIVAAIVVVVVTVAADTVITVEGNEFTLEETATTFGEVDLSPGTNDLLTGDATLLDCEIFLLPDVLDTLVATDVTDVVTLLGDETDTLVAGDKETLLLAAVTLVGEDTLLDVMTDGLLTGLKLLLTDTEVLFVGDEALCVCDAILFTGGDTLHEEVTLLTEEETFSAGDTSVAKSTVASEDILTIESGTMEVLTESGLITESLETATTLPEFALALLDTVRLLGGGVPTTAPDILLLLTAPLSEALSLLLLTDVHELLPTKPATAAVSKRCRFFGVAITE